MVFTSPFPKKEKFALFYSISVYSYMNSSVSRHWMRHYFLPLSQREVPALISDWKAFYQWAAFHQILVSLPSPPVVITPLPIFNNLCQSKLCIVLPETWVHRKLDNPLHPNVFLLFTTPLKKYRASPGLTDSIQKHLPYFGEKYPKRKNKSFRTLPLWESD